MKTLLRMYAPVVVLLFWALVVSTVGLSGAGAAVALTTLAVSVKVQVDEARRQHRQRKNGAAH